MISPVSSRRWMRSAFLRRLLLACLVALPTLLATAYMAGVLPGKAERSWKRR